MSVSLDITRRVAVMALQAHSIRLCEKLQRIQIGGSIGRMWVMAVTTMGLSLFKQAARTKDSTIKVVSRNLPSL